MSVHSSLVSAWPADLVTVAVATTSSQVYFGRREQHVTRSDREIWIERLEVDERGSGAQLVRGHRYRVHVRLRSNAGGDVTGKAQQDTVEALARTLAESYRGTRRLRAASGLSGLIAWDAVEESADLDPDDAATIDAPVLLTCLVKE